MPLLTHLFTQLLGLIGEVPVYGAVLPSSPLQPSPDSPFLGVVLSLSACLLSSSTYPASPPKLSFCWCCGSLAPDRAERQGWPCPVITLIAVGGWAWGDTATCNCVDGSWVWQEGWPCLVIMSVHRGRVGSRRLSHLPLCGWLPGRAGSEISF